MQSVIPIFQKGLLQTGFSFPQYFEPELAVVNRWPTEAEGDIIDCKGSFGDPTRRARLQRLNALCKYIFVFFYNQ